jgi:hypothetical protein
VNAAVMLSHSRRKEIVATTTKVKSHQVRTIAIFVVAFPLENTGIHEKLMMYCLIL